jgi:hypothetical protein
LAGFFRQLQPVGIHLGLLAVAVLGLSVVAGEFDSVFAHGIGGKDAAFVAATKGPDILPFMYLGAKHMVTGYDHLLFLLGVIFFLYRMRDVVLYVTLFSIGHSITLLAGVLLKIDVTSYLVDAVIGLSVSLQGVRQPRWLQMRSSACSLIMVRLQVLGSSTDSARLHEAAGASIECRWACSGRDRIQCRGGTRAAHRLGRHAGDYSAMAADREPSSVWRWRRMRSNLTAGFMLMEYQLAGYFVGGRV